MPASVERVQAEAKRAANDLKEVWLEFIEGPVMEEEKKSPAEKLAEEKGDRKRKKKSSVSGERMRMKRVGLKLTMRDVSNAVGICHTFVHQIEVGMSEPGVAIAIRLAKFYGTTVEELFGE